MGLVVDIGLERFYDADEAMWHEAAVRSLVEEGFTTLARDWIGEDVFEVRSTPRGVAKRWLPAAERALIAADRDAIGAPSAEFSWDELDRLHCDFIRDLAFERDGANTSPTIVLPGSFSLTVIDLKESLQMNWRGRRHRQAKIAAKLHAYAARHRLVVHSA